MKKTKILDVDTCRQESVVKVDGERVENVKSFEYLGALITADGDCSKEVKRRLAIAARKLQEFRTLLKSSNNTVKLRILHSCIFPIASYGCEAWTISRNIANRINAFENKCYRTILGVSWTEHRTNESIANELGVTSGFLFRFIQKQKLKYFGHLKRHDCLERIVIEGRVEGKRGRGRPKRQWHEDVVDWLGMTIGGAGRAAEDRTAYRSSVKAATSHVVDRRQ